MATRQPITWAVHDGKIGMANQVLGLAEAVGWPIVEKRLAVRWPWSRLTPALWLTPRAALGSGGDRLTPPWPDLLIACGRNSVAPSRAAKRASLGRIFWVQVQDPRFARAEIDLIVSPRHDSGHGANVWETLGAVHRVTPAKLAEGARRFGKDLTHLPRPLTAVLIGGDNKVYRLSEARLKTLADQLAALAAQGHGLAITTSRRSGARVAATLGARLPQNRVYLWDGAGDNPYFGLLALADAVVVTADSVSMVSEAVATGKPVHVVELDGGSAKFARFHEALQSGGMTRPFAGRIEQWHYAPPDDTARAAAEIRRRFAARSEAAP